MTALEIIMLIIGIICFVCSFLLTKDDAEPVTKRRVNYKAELTEEQINSIKDKVDNIVTNRLAELEESTEAGLDKISNTKIMEMNEYAESVLNEINKNHNETVFMYDMLNEKSKEIKNIVREINEAKNQMEASRSEIAGNSSYAEGLLKEAEKAVKELDIAIKAAYKTKSNIFTAADETKIKEEKIPDNVIKPQFFEQNADKDYADESSIQKLDSYMAKVEPETILASNCNEQILMMHSEGKSNLEIAKTLNLGMGEVKLVIDLFNKKK